MVRHKRSDDWGFPRWRSYGNKSRDAAKVRLCDRDGCANTGDRPAPKAPNSPERWYFCEAHAAEYNRNWNYFAGLDPEQAAKRAADEARDASGFNHSQHWKWGGPGDGSRSREEMRALSILEVEADAEFKAIKAAYRRLAKSNHPDLKPGDADAATRFKQIQAAYDVLSKAEERRLALGRTDSAREA
ncbi:MAG: J domain-containing protein [Sphingomicrobium sp.]